jgi:hypothetical protein
MTLEYLDETRKALAARDAARVEGKRVRRLETDNIAKLVEYAKGQGSSHPDKYYIHLTKAVNSMLGIGAGERDKLDADTLQKITAAEALVGFSISDGLAAGLPYKDVYQMVKNRVNDLGIIINSKVLKAA